MKFRLMSNTVRTNRANSKEKFNQYTLDSLDLVFLTRVAI